MKVKLSEIKLSESLSAMRFVDPFTVSRYRIAMRAGAKFPPITIDGKTREVVNGQHRFTAMLAEFGEDHEVDVIVKTYKSDADRIRAFAADNIANGRPMDSFTMDKITQALTDAGDSVEAIAALFNVTVGNLKHRMETWAGRRVMVIGKDKKRTLMPVKAGGLGGGRPMTLARYEAHVRQDIGVTVAQLAHQLADRIEGGEYDAGDEQTAAALDRLRAALKG
jgi:hypothetical protein